MNIFQTRKFMHKTKYGINLRVFLHQSRELDTNIRQDFPKRTSITKNLSVNHQHCNNPPWPNHLEQLLKLTQEISHLLLFLREPNFNCITQIKK